MVLEGMPALTGEQLQAQREARLSSPEAVQSRTQSETAYEGLSASESQELAGRAFPGLVNEPNGGPPRLPEGERIVNYSSDVAASLALPEGKHGVLNSLAPIAVEDPASGQRVPIDLSPSGNGL